MDIKNFKLLAKQIFPNYKQSKYYPYYKDFHHKLESLNYKLMEIRDPRIKQLANELQRENPIVMYCLGARYGLPSNVAYYLREKKFLLGVGFEPDPVEAQRLKDENLFDIILPYALGNENGVQTLYITENPGCSSLLLPHTENINLFCEQPEWFNVNKKVDIEVHRLDKIIEREQLPYPDFLQIDTQGFEFEVLMGSANILSQVSAIELEAQMYLLYIGQKLFADIHDFLTERGFILFLMEKAGIFGMNYVEANVCYYNKALLNKSPKTQALINYCSITHGINSLKFA